MKTKWTIFFSEQKNLCTLRIPARLDNAIENNNSKEFLHLDEMGLEFWEYEILHALVSVERSSCVCTTAYTWKKSRLSSSFKKTKFFNNNEKFSDKKISWHYFSWWQRVLVTIPALSGSNPDAILKWVGWDTEELPDMLFISEDKKACWDTKLLKTWCKDKNLWWNHPDNIIPNYAERLILMYYGDMYIAVKKEIVDDIFKAVKSVFAKWNINIIKTKEEFAWL